uniref:Uncharacterized protein n=1 Tax=Anguilla anguilla TaxID=7936 RepID=A0A0E9TBU0_ANGAN
MRNLLSMAQVKKSKSHAACFTIRVHPEFLSIEKRKQSLFMMAQMQQEV